MLNIKQKYFNDLKVGDKVLKVYEEQKYCIVLVKEVHRTHMILSDGANFGKIPRDMLHYFNHNTSDGYDTYYASPEAGITIEINLHTDKLKSLKRIKKFLRK